MRMDAKEYMSAYTQRNLAQAFNRAFIFYNFLFVLALLIVMLRDPNSPITFMMFVLLLPVFVFFTYYAWNHLVLLMQKDKKNWYFSWKAFFTQDNAMFFITLAFFVLALNLVLARRAQNFANLVFSSTRVIQHVNATNQNAGGQ